MISSRKGIGYRDAEVLVLLDRLSHLVAPGHRGAAEASGADGQAVRSRR